MRIGAGAHGAGEETLRIPPQFLRAGLMTRCEQRRRGHGGCGMKREVGALGRPPSAAGAGVRIYSIGSAVFNFELVSFEFGMTGPTMAGEMCSIGSSSGRRPAWRRSVREGRAPSCRVDRCGRGGGGQIGRDPAAGQGRPTADDDEEELVVLQSPAAVLVAALRLFIR